MTTITSKRRVYHKLIALVTVSFFFLNVFTADVLALAPELRTKPFSEATKLEFETVAKMMSAAGEIRSLVAEDNARENPMIRLNLNERYFPNGEVEIDNVIHSGSFKCSDRAYNYALFHFRKENKTIKAIFIRDYDKLGDKDKLTDDELAELGVKTDDDRKHFNYSREHPALRGVWFVKVPAQAEPSPKTAQVGIASGSSDRGHGKVSSSRTPADPDEREKRGHVTFDWVELDELTRRHYTDGGLLQPDEYPAAYAFIRGIFDRLWEHSPDKHRKGKPGVYLTGSEKVSAGMSKERNIYISLGMLRFLQKYNDNRLYEEDIAFILAHELMHYTQVSDNIKALHYLDRGMMHAKEYDADQGALTIMNRAGYSVARVEKFFQDHITHKNARYLETVRNVRREFAMVDDIARKIRDGKYKELARDPEIRAVLSYIQGMGYDYRVERVRQWLARARTFHNIIKGSRENYLKWLDGYKESRLHSIKQEEEVSGFNPVWIPADLGNRVQYDPEKKTLRLSEHAADIAEEDIARIKETMRRDSACAEYDAKRLSEQLDALYKKLRDGKEPVPYFESHPVDNNRIAHLEKYVSTHYLKNIKMSYHAAADAVLSEILRKTASEKNMSVYKHQEHGVIMERVREIEDWQEVIFLVAPLDRDVLTDSLLSALEEDLEKRGYPRTRKESYLLQLYLLFGKKEKRDALVILNDINALLRYVPVFPGRFGQDTYWYTLGTPEKQCAARRYHFMNNILFSFATKAIKERVAREPFNRDLFMAFAERYRRFCSPGGEHTGYLRDRYTAIMRTLLRSIPKDRAIDNEMLHLIYQVCWVSTTLYSEIEDIAYVQIRDNPALVPFFRTVIMQNPLSVPYRILREYHDKDFAALGKTYREALDNIFFIYDRESVFGSFPNGFFDFWLEAIYEKYKPEGDDGSFAFEYITYLAGFLNEEKEHKDWHIDPSFNTWDREIVYKLRPCKCDYADSVLRMADRLIGRGTEKAERKKRTIVDVLGVKDERERKRRICDTLPGIRQGESIEIEYRDDKGAKRRHCAVFGMPTARVVQESIEVYGRRNIDGSLARADRKEIALKEIEKISISVPVYRTGKPTRFDELVRNEVIAELLKGDPAPLDGIGSVGTYLIFLLSKGVLMDPEQAIVRYFDYMKMDEIRKIYLVIRKYFTDDLCERTGIKKARMHGMDMRNSGQSIFIGKEPLPSVETFEEFLLSLSVYITLRDAYPDSWRQERGMVSRNFIGELTSGDNLLDEMTPLKKLGEVYPLPIRRVYLNEAYPTNTVTRKSGFKGYNEKEWKEQILERKMKPADFDRFSKAFFACWAPKGAELTWEGTVRLVVSVLPESVFRNYFLYYLYAGRFLSEEYKGDPLRFDEVDLELAGKVAEKRRKLYEAWKIIAPYFVKDGYVHYINKRRVEGHMLKATGDESYSILSDAEESMYKARRGRYKQMPFAERGTQDGYVDLAVGGVFREELLSLIRSAAPYEEKIAGITRVFGRKSNTRDEYLDMLVRQIEEQGAGLSVLDEIFGLLESDVKKTRVGLLCLEKIHEEHPALTFSDELGHVLRYFKDRSDFRDDILRSMEYRSASTQDEIRRLKELYTIDESTQTDREVADIQEGKDNAEIALRPLNAKEKQSALLWLVGFQQEKPASIKKMELMHSALFDVMRRNSVYDTAHYRNMGRTARLDILEELLIRGNHSIIRDGKLKECNAALWKGMIDKYGIDSRDARAKKRNGAMLEILQSITDVFKDDPLRQFKIVSEALLVMERLDKDPVFLSENDDIKLAHVAKAFLGASGIIGIKIAQHLSASDSFGLSPEFKAVLKKLTEEAEGIDKEAVFSILEELGEDAVAIDKILGAASFKTTIRIRGSDELYKLKNLQAFYEARSDLKLLETLLTDLTRKRIINIRQNEEILEELRSVVREEEDFELEKKNAEELRQNHEKRKGATLQGGFLYRRIYRMAERTFGDLSGYRFDFAQVGSVHDNMLIKEKDVVGVSLGKYTGSDKERIYKAVILELMRQMFEDGVYHGDPHPGNIFVRDGADGKKEIVFIDMGRINRISRKDRTVLLLMVPRMFIRSVMSQGYLRPATSIVDAALRKLAGLLTFRTRKCLDKASYLIDKQQEVDKSVTVPMAAPADDKNPVGVAASRVIPGDTLPRSPVPVQGTGDSQGTAHEALIQAESASVAVAEKASAELDSLAHEALIKSSTPLSGLPEETQAAVQVSAERVAGRFGAKIISDAAHEARKEAAVIHAENMKREHMPAIADKELLCHIVTDTILPSDQRNMLKISVDQAMDKKNKHIERVAALSGENVGNPDKYIEDLRALIKRKQDLYTSLGYTKVRFTLACPDVKLVDKVLGSGIDIKALAFEPCDTSRFNLVQAEGIMLALRALDSGDLAKLKSVYAFLAKHPLSPEDATITDINTFIRKVAFILPAARVEDYELKRTLHYLASQIWQAA
jgi:hypothetical protein